MDTVEGWYLVALQVTCRTDIGRDHELLDHLVCIIAYRRHNAINLLSFTKEDLCLHGIEIDRTTNGTCIPEHLVE